MRLLVDWKSAWEQHVSSVGVSGAGANSPMAGPSHKTGGAASSGGSGNAEALSLVWWKEVDAATPLRLYVLEILKALPAPMKSQKTMLAIWLVEIYLHQIAAAENYESLGLYNSPQTAPTLRRDEITSDFQRFLRDFSMHLDYPTVVSLITARNQRSLLLYFTRIMGDYHRVVSILITSQKYSEALSLLMDAQTEKIELFIYKIAPMLMEHEPERTVEMLSRKEHLSFASLLPMIMHYTSKLDERVLQAEKYADHEDVTHVEDNYAIRYVQQQLERCGIFLYSSSSSGTEGGVSGVGEDDADRDGIDLDLWGSSTVEPVLIHTLVWLLAKYDPTGREERLTVLLSRLVQLREMRFLDDHVALDMEYILRMCRMFHRKQSAIRALLLLQHRLAAVTEALSVDVGLAKVIAQKEGDVEMKKKLWLVIAGHQIAHDVDIKQAIAVITESDGVLQIEVGAACVRGCRSVGRCVGRYAVLTCGGWCVVCWCRTCCRCCRTSRRSTCSRRRSVRRCRRARTVSTWSART